MGKGTNYKYALIYFNDLDKFGVVSVAGKLATDRIKFRCRKYIKTQMRDYLQKNYKRKLYSLHTKFFSVTEKNRILVMFWFTK